MQYYVIVKKKKNSQLFKCMCILYSNSKLAVGEHPHFGLVPPTLSDIKQGALATDLTCRPPQRSPD